MISNIHASCVTLQSQGILLLGSSGSGKSDLALRLITSYGCQLVADDRVDITIKENQIIATCPKTLQGLLEIRGIGIVKYPFVSQTPVKIAIQLTSDKIERMPAQDFYEIEGIKIPLFRLNSFESSSPAKVLTALNIACDDLKNGG